MMHLSKTLHIVAQMHDERQDNAIFSKVSRLVKMAVAAVVVGSALLVVPGGAAHAAGGGQDWCRQMIAQGVPGVYFFEHTSYQGNCQYFTQTGSWTFNGSWNDSASSIKVVGSGTWDIILYKDSNITIFGDSYHTYNSIPDFTEVRMVWGTNLNDQVSSFSLWYR